MDNNHNAFFELVRAGLWEKEAQLALYRGIDYASIYELAEKQSVVGLITAGLERVQDVSVPKEWTLQFIGSTLQIEQQNKSMNAFIGQLIEKLRIAEVYTLLVKGQGIAQCYERPFWRSCGDVDLYLSKDNYDKAKALLLPMASYTEEEDKKKLHLGMTIDGWVVELHGTLYGSLSRRVNNGIEEAHRDVFYGGNVRSWMCGNTLIFLPGVDNDVTFVFTHILQHYFGGGIGLRQICDWCRLLWTYRDKLDRRLLEQRIRKMGLIVEWKAFATLAVIWLGMPVEAMPLINENDCKNEKLKRKAARIITLILDAGNFGHGRDDSFKKKYPKVISYLISFGIFTKYALIQFSIFPVAAIKGWGRVIRLGVKNKLKKN